MFKRKLMNKCLAFGISFTIVLGGMTGVTAKGDSTADMETASASEEWETMGIPENEEDAADECPSGSLGGDVYEYGEILVISEKDGNSESIALSKKEQKAAEKAARKAEEEAKKAAKEKEKEDKKNQKDQEKEDKKDGKEQEKADKEQQKEERKLAKKLDKEKHEKTSVINSVDDYEELWNIVSVGSAGSGTNAVLTDPGVAVADPVKVAILDSGVDYTDDIDVYMRKNFIPGEDDISVIYEDISGHGTSVAGIIAAKNNNEGITGINPDVRLYSARILDENKQAPASRVVAAIDWAIGQDVDIINISFGTTVDSEEIHAAIKRAYDAGILIIAAAGNNGVVEYPAAYDEVVAVGAVDAKGERAEGSAIGDELELVAPGQQIVSTGAFGGVCVVGGTSLAAPHVTAVASVLWQKDKSVPADFIRSLLAFTANQYGEDYEYGNGLVDLDFALSQYDTFKEVYVADADVLNEQVGAAVEDGTLEVNEKPVEEFADVVYVEGSWGPNRHEALADSGKSYLGNDLSVLKIGAIAPDTYIGGMKRNSVWHGFDRRLIPNTTTTEYYSNYVYSYMLITYYAVAAENGQSLLSVSAPAFSCVQGCPCVDFNTKEEDKKKNVKLCIKKIPNAIKDNFGANGIIFEDDSLRQEIGWMNLLQGYATTNHNKALFIYGMALHTVTDAFAHSSYVNGRRISHPDADEIETTPNRNACASEIAKRLAVNASKKQRGSASDFLAIMSVYDGSFQLGYLKHYVKAVDEGVYNNNRGFFEKINEDDIMP